MPEPLRTHSATISGRAVQRNAKIAASLGECLRASRKAKRISQQDAAKLAGCSASTIKRLEGGDAAEQVQNLLCLAKVLDMDLGDLDVRDSRERQLLVVFRTLDNAAKDASIALLADIPETMAEASAAMARVAKR